MEIPKFCETSNHNILRWRSQSQLTDRCYVTPLKDTVSLNTDRQTITLHVECAQPYGELCTICTVCFTLQLYANTVPPCMGHGGTVRSTVASQQEGRGFKSCMVQHVGACSRAFLCGVCNVLHVFTRVPPIEPQE